MLIGVLSDTHFLRDAVINPSPAFLNVYNQLQEKFQGVSHIIHAGDVTSMEFYEKLTQIAPTTVVRGNRDQSPQLSIWPKFLLIEIGGVRIGVGHQLENFDDIEPEHPRVYIYGHTHVPSIRESPENVLFLNPGSPTHPRPPPPRKNFPQQAMAIPTVAILSIDGEIVGANIIRLKR